MFDSEVARAVSDAARIVHARNRRAGLDLHDLVQIGWERVLRYLGRDTTNHVLAFVCAKGGMILHLKRDRKRGLGFRLGSAARSIDPKFASIEDRDLGYWDQWTRQSLPVEEMIDAKRALLSMPLREAVAWHSHHWLGHEYTHLEDEFGVSGGRIRQLAAAGNAKMRATIDVPHVPTKSRRYQEERERYADLRARGATRSQASNGCKGPHAYAALVRQLDGAT